jgi:SAM-dependent methyltransferase
VVDELAPHHRYVGSEYDASETELTRLDLDDPIEYAITARYLQRYVAAASIVADVGVGGGQYSELLARRGCRLHLVDVSRRLLDATAVRLATANLAGHIISSAHASATDLVHIADRSCDVVLLLGPLYHLITSADRRRAVLEAARILRPEGLLFAAGINVLTYLRDIIRGDVEEFARRRQFFLEDLWHDGSLTKPDGQPASMHVTTAAELRAEISPPFQEVVLAGVESFASKGDGRLAYLRASPEARSIMLDLIERSGVSAEGLGLTSHYLFVGRRPL